MRLRSVLAAFFAVLFFSCMPKNEVINSSAPAGRFSTDIKPIFDRNCNSSDCHGGTPHGFGGGLNLTSYKGLFEGSRYGTVVVSGSPFMSHLVQSVNQTDTNISPISSAIMPVGRDLLSAADIQTIVNWIRDGARDDDGSLPFTKPEPASKLFFSSQSVDLVGIIDPALGLITRYVSVGNPLPLTSPPQAPHYVQIDDAGQYYYVTLITANLLRKYDASTNQLVGQVHVGTSPAHVVITHNGTKAYVTNFDLTVGRVIAVNTATMTVLDTIRSAPFMKGTHGARLSHDGQYLYIGNNGTDLVTVVSTANDSVITEIPVAGDVPPFGSFIYKPYQIAVRGDDRFIYVTLNGRGLVSVIERNGDQFTVRDTIPVGVKPLQCEVTPDQRYLYVCNQGSGTVSVIDAQSNSFLTTVSDVGKQPHGVDVSDNSRTVYVTCENQVGSDPPHHPVVGSKVPGYVVFIDVASQRVFRKVEVGAFAAGVSVYPGAGN